MKWGIVITVILLAMSLLTGSVLADDVYIPGKGMAYGVKPSFPEGTIVQYCKDDGGVMWQCTSGTVVKGVITRTPTVTNGYTDEQWSRLPIIWGTYTLPERPVITEIASNPVQATLPIPTPTCNSFVFVPGWFDATWLKEFKEVNNREPTEADYIYRYCTMLAKGG